MEAAVGSDANQFAGAAPIPAARNRYRTVAASLLPGIALALALRVVRLSFQPLWWDEGYSVWFATHSLGEMARLTAEDIHPPLYYALLHLWTQLFGPGPVSARLLSVVFGVLAIPVIYLAARRILDSRRAALIAAILLAVNPLHVYYSQEVRMYGLVALLSGGILWAAWRIFEARETRFLKETWFLGLPYILLVTLALYTQYYAVFLPIGLTLYALWHWRRDAQALVRWFGLQLIAALLYLPWVIYAAPRLTLYVSQKVVHDADRPLGPLVYLARHLAAYTVGHLEGPLAAWWPLALVLLLPVVVGLVLLVRAWSTAGASILSEVTSATPQQASILSEVPPTTHQQASILSGVPPAVRRDGVEGRLRRAHPIAFLATVLSTILVLGWLIGLRYPFFPDRGERLLLLGLPAFVMLVAAGLTGLARAKNLSGLRDLTGLGLLGASAVSLVFFYTVSRYPEDDYRPLIARTVEQGLPEDTVFAVYPWQVGYWRSYAADIDGPTAMLTPSAEWGVEVATALDNALARGRVWFPAHLSLGAILETEIESQLGMRAVPFANTWYGAGTRLSAWSRANVETLEAAVPVDGVTAQYVGSDGAFFVSGGTPWQGPIPAANAVAPLALQWTGQWSTPGEAAVSVRLTDDLGQIWGQNDYEPAVGMVGSNGMQAGAGMRWAYDRLGLLIPAGTPPGRYSVQLVVSTPDGATLPAEVDGKTLQSLPLFPLEVTAADRTLGAERLPIATRQATDLEDGLRFLGFTLDDAPLAPGETRRVNLFWQATGQPTADYTAFVQALGRDGAPPAGWEAAPGAGFATSQWQSGTLIRTQATIRFPAETPDGRYPLIAGLYNPANGQRLKTERGAEQVSLGRLTIVGRPHQMNPPAPQTPTDVALGQVARLVGYDRGENTADGALTVTLHWQALGATDRPLTVFVHLVDKQGNVIGYGDGEPGSGAYPTTGWLKDEYLTDTHTVTFQPGALDGGPARLAVGLYDPSTGERVLTADGQDQLVIALQ